MKAIIVDDERLARKELISLLNPYKNISIAAEADDVDSAIKVIEKYSPDVIFLDIQMPGKSGFDLLNLIDINAKVIFVTAYDEFAIRAFEINAVDYLLKPINPERLKIAISRLGDINHEEKKELSILNYDDHLFLSITNKLKFVKVNTIITINAARDYSEVLFSDGQKGLTLKTMKEWENRLPASHFCRIHRSTIINLNYVENVEEWFNNSYKVFLKNIDTSLVMSRRYASDLKSKMG